MIDFNKNCENNLSVIELSYNNSYHSSISMTLYEALYGKRCNYVVGWFVVGVSSLRVISDRLKMAYSRKISYADNIRRDLEFEVVGKVNLNISPMKLVMRFGKRGS